MRIRQVLKEKDDQTEAELFDCLRTVGLMKISVEILKVRCWKGVVDEWVSATTAATDMTLETVNPSVLNERIVPATQTPPTFEHTKSYNDIVEDNKTKKQQSLCQVNIADEKSQTKKTLKPLRIASELEKHRSEPMGTQKKTSTCSQEVIMVPKTKTLKDWRDYFRRANTDIFDADGEGREGGRDGCESGSEKSVKESNNSIVTIDETEVVLKEESQVVREVMRIRQLLKQKDDQTEAELFDCLRRVGLMKISVEILKVTNIRRAVNNLRKHNSKRIRSLVRSLIIGWRGVVDEWVSSTTDITDMTPEITVHPSVLDERNVPATQTTLAFEHTKSYDNMVEDNKIKKQQPLCQVNIAEKKNQTKKIMKPFSTGSSGLGKN
ncbi:putative mediator of RNA polymerase II transcription subunit 26b [Acorus calamus]|uniref:Mediator of RNA polymerase II transcription subunit 26b n=1 Tax=Acorus calamus TaxID=4465 RepID=A0AAV9F4T6_ACOCL|nr:putative mediator of RNA polymerase II transcription subunit 26b [Acorus calamus]